MLRHKGEVEPGRAAAAHETGSEAASIYELLEGQAAARPEGVALAAAGRAPLTYEALLRQVRQTVVAMRAFGLERNDRVAVVLPNGPEMAAAFLGVAAGATCAPLNPVYRESELDFFISDLGAKALITLSGSDSAARAAARARHIPIIELSPATDQAAGTSRLTGDSQAPDNSGGFAEPGDCALVLHTSGTTSRPKIVPLTHANLCHSARSIALTLALTESDRCLNVMPLFHIHGLIGAVLSSLTAGASVFCSPGFDPERFFAWMDAFRPSWYTAVPTMHQAILARAPENQEIIKARPLRLVRSSSAALPRQVMAALEEAFDAPVIESYGMTEASHQVASNPLPPRARKPGSVGRAAGPDVAIMDESATLVGTDEIGQVVIRGGSVTAGYENNEEANQEAYADGWFRTGDQGRLDAEGYLFLTGRLKEIINRGGEKIAPAEVDETLMRHPAIAQAVAFAVPHSTLGEDVAAAVVLEAGSAADEKDIREFASSSLADFKVPSRVLILGEIPKGPTGKLQRIGLASELADKLGADFVAARTAVEESLVATWKRLLQQDALGVQDSFFVLGGDSITASVMIFEVEREFDRQIPLDAFLRSPTVETLAVLVGQSPSGEAAAGGVVGGRRATTIRDTMLRGAKNRVLQILALYAPGYRSTRVWLHRMRGVAIGTNVSIGTGALIETAYPSLVSIGDNVTIGMRAVISAHLRDLTSQARSAKVHTVRIEDDVYLGPGVIVLPNVTVGRGAVVSAGSVVSRSVPPGMLVQGNPAVPVAECGVSLGGGVSYEQFLRHLKPLAERR